MEMSDAKGFEYYLNEIGFKKFVPHELYVAYKTYINFVGMRTACKMLANYYAKFIDNPPLTCGINKL